MKNTTIIRNAFIIILSFFLCLPAMAEEKFSINGDTLGYNTNPDGEIEWKDVEELRTILLDNPKITRLILSSEVVRSISLLILNLIHMLSMNAQAHALIFFLRETIGRCKEGPSWVFINRIGMLRTLRNITRICLSSRIDERSRCRCFGLLRP